MSINICFFGVIRDFESVHESILKKIIDPCREVSDTQIFAHLIEEAEIVSPRTGEHFRPNYDLFWNFFRNDEVISEDLTSNNTIRAALVDVEPWGDAWQDAHYSTMNLLKQLYSVSRVYEASRKKGADIYIFSRLDVLYLDSIAPTLKKVLRDPNFSHSAFYTPNWQMSGGYNDRFCITRGLSAAEAFGRRLDIAGYFCERNRCPLHGERLLKYVMDHSDLWVRKLPFRFSRVRAGGIVVKEDFRAEWLRRLMGA